MKIKKLKIFCCVILLLSCKSISAIEIDSVSDISTQNTLHTLASTNIKQEYIFETITTINSNFADKFQLIYPESNLITVKDKIKIKGINQFLTSVFINGEKMKVRNDGRFHHKHILKDYGKQTLFITFTTPEYNLINLKRKIIRLYSPPDIEKFVNNRKEYIYFFNSPFIFNPDKNRKLSSTFTRADLAYFINALFNNRSTDLTTNVFEDVNKNHWAAGSIKYVTDNNIMSEFPDGTFRPDHPVKKIEYIISLVKANNYKPEEYNSNLKYKDINLGSWTAKFVKTALARNIIPESSTLNPNKNLSIKSFIDLIKYFPSINIRFKELLSFENGFEAEDLKQESLSSVIDYLKKRKKELINKRKIEISHPVNGQLIIGSKVHFTGKVFPSERFKINDQTCLPDINGNFYLTSNLKPGENNVTIYALDKKITVSLISIEGYRDLNNHWLKETAAKLRYIKIFNNEPLFIPAQKIRRAAFASQLLKALDIDTIYPADQKNIKLLDVATTSPHYSSVVSLIHKGILSSNNNGLFRPDQYITKAEAITAVIRALKIKESPEEITLPYKDIKKNYWAIPFIKSAYEIKIIAPSKYFKPKKYITKAEWGAILSKTPPVRKKLMKVFGQ